PLRPRIKSGWRRTLAALLPTDSRTTSTSMLVDLRPARFRAGPMAKGERMANKDAGTGSGARRPSGGTGRNRNAYCSFCRKNYREVGPLVEGPGDVYICGE